MHTPDAAPRRVVILGSTGSIGTQALQVVDAHPQALQVVGLSCQSSHEVLIAQALRYRPQVVVVGTAQGAEVVSQALAGTPTQVCHGPEALAALAAHPQADVVLTALVGAAGLVPTLAAIEARKTVALANKETLVVAGQLVMHAARQQGATILPVDSEHSALHQCLAGEDPQSIHRLILTASGGPFRGYTAEQLAAVTLAQALKHPNWSMGAKITIDSASLMNKGLEVIEARWLFDVPPEQIDVVVHPQSIIHSMVEFNDGSVKAQLGLPDMRLPIQYALLYPERPLSPYPRFDVLAHPQLTFQAPDRGVFRTLGLAFEALRLGGTAPCALNAANEVAVAAVLAARMPFASIFGVLEEALAQSPFTPDPDLPTLLDTDAQVRRLTQALLPTA